MVLAVFNFPLRRVWARAEPAPEGVRLRLASVANRDVLFAREFEGLALTVDKQVAALVRETGGRGPAGTPGSPATVEGAVHALH